jgi:hypothetical protein
MSSFVRRISVLSMLVAASFIARGSRPTESGALFKIVTAVQRLQGGES